MAKQVAAVSESKPNIFHRMREFFQEVQMEMKKVSWPSREELKSSTFIVLIMLCIFAVIIGVYDRVFHFIMMLFLRLG
jgi:preprotein translocase subunit SecE